MPSRVICKRLLLLTHTCKRRCLMILRSLLPPANSSSSPPDTLRSPAHSVEVNNRPCFVHFLHCFASSAHSFAFDTERLNIAFNERLRVCVVCVSWALFWRLKGWFAFLLLLPMPITASASNVISKRRLCIGVRHSPFARHILLRLNFLQISPLKANWSRPIFIKAY